MKKRRILLGTNNAHKLNEIRAILTDFPVEIVTLKDLSLEADVEEDGKSYLENAIIKAKYFSKIANLPCISDDTGLEVEILQGEPGVHSARWSGVEGRGRYKANNEKLLQKLKDVPVEKRKARFICTIVLVNKDKVIMSCEGRCQGRIAFSPRGEQGFGYDPLFEVPEYNKTFAELPEKIKNQISHRARALQQFQKQFSQLSSWEMESDI